MMVQAAPQNAAGLHAARFFLGLAESSAYPAFVVLISVWYRKGEHTGRFAALYGADIIAQGIGGLLLFGLASINGVIAGWRIAMLIAGAMSIVVGLVFAWLTPAKIKNAWFLTPEERQIAHDRVAAEHASGETKQWSWPQFYKSLMDPRVSEFWKPPH